MKNTTRLPLFWGVHAMPGPTLTKVLACIPFVIAIACYAYFSHQRHLVNEQDKILPTISQMAKAVHTMAFTEDRRTGHYLLWLDTAASLKRIGIGVGISAAVGLLLGLNMALFRGAGAITLAFVTFASIVPPLSILPILFITFGVGELGKIMLIIIGASLTITRSIYLEVSKIPREQIIKAITLGASQLDIAYRIILPQILPRLIDTVRIALGGAWLFLIAAEAIASTEGLGYRIYLMQRYLAMDVIIPYVIWITLIGFACDRLLKWTLTTCYRWYGETN